MKFCCALPKALAPTIFCIVCAVVVIVLGLALTRSGSGVSDDSVTYILTGEGLRAGNGFGGLVTAGPVYPLLIAAATYLGLSATDAAGMIPIACFALLMFPLFWLGKALSGNSTIGYLSCLICLALAPVWRLVSYSWTEAPYMLLSALAIVFLVKYVRSNTGGLWFLALGAAFIALASLTRYVGFFLIPAGLVAILVKEGAQLKRVSGRGLLLILISCLPMIPWIYRSTTETGVFAGYARDWGGMIGTGMGPMDNVYYVAGIIGHTIFRLPVDLPPMIAVAVLGVLTMALVTIITALHHLTDAKLVTALREYVSSNAVIITYLVVYLLAIFLVKSFWHEKYVESRYITVVYPLLAITILSLGAYVYQRITVKKRAVTAALTALCVGFIVLHAVSLSSFYTEAEQGQCYTAPEWRENKGIAWVTDNVDTDTTIYTNNRTPLRLRLDNTLIGLPYYGDTAKMSAWLKRLDSGAHILCFKVEGHPDWPCSKISPLCSEVASKGQDVLVTVMEFEDSIIWEVLP